MITKIKQWRDAHPRLWQMGSYLLFGLLTTGVNWLSYLALTSLLGLAAQEKNSAAYTLIVNVSQIISWLASVLFAYFTNRRFVFDSKTRGRALIREMWQFVWARALGYLLFDLLVFNALLLFMRDRPAKLVVNAFVIVFNYLASRFVVFNPGRMKGKNTQGE